MLIAMEKNKFTLKMRIEKNVRKLNAYAYSKN